MADLSNVVRMLIHQLDATRSYLLPSYCDEDEKARAVIAFAESALAAEPAFAASEPSDEDLADLSEVFNGDPLPAIRRALELWGRPTIAALAAEPPAPAPAADGEREELAQWLDHKGRGAWPCPDGFSAKAEAEEYEMFSGLTRAATLLREPAPAPVPGWQPISTAPQDGTEILASDYDAIEIVSWDAWETGSGWIDRNGQRLFPAWWQPLQDHPPIPQPPQDEEVEE